MRIRSKFFVINAIIFAALLLEISLFFFQHQARTRRIALSEQLHFIQPVLSRFIGVTGSLAGRSGTFEELARFWNAALLRANRAIENLERWASADVKLRQAVDPLIQSWNTYLKREVETSRQLIGRLRKFPDFDVHARMESLNIFATDMVQANTEDPTNRKLGDLATLLEDLLAKMRLTYARGHALWFLQLEAIGVDEQKAENRDIVVFMASSTAVLSALLLGIILFRILSQRIVSRISSVADGMTALVEGDYNLPVDIKSRDELGDLSENFSNLRTKIWNRLSLLNQSLGGLDASKDLATLKEAVLRLAVDGSGANGGLMLVEDESTGLVKADVILGEQAFPVPTAYYEQKNPAEVREMLKTFSFNPGNSPITEPFISGKTLFIRNNLRAAAGILEEEGTFTTMGGGVRSLQYNCDPKSPNFISSCLALPLILEEKVTAVIVVTKSKLDSLFSDLDRLFLECYGEYAILVLDNFLKYNELRDKRVIDQDIAVASHLQRTFFPERIPTGGYLDVGIYTQAARGVSGDYHDYLILPEDSVAVVVCDVAGKGIPATMGMIMVRTILHAVVPGKKNAGEVLTELNKGMIDCMEGGDNFATMTLVIFNPHKKDISYANAAHIPLLIFRGGEGVVRKFDAKGLPLGISHSSSYEEKRIRVRPGDYLLLLSDGITEARNAQGQEFGMDQLLETLTPALKEQAEPETLTSLVGERMEHFSRGTYLHDDQTFLGVKVVNPTLEDSQSKAFF